MLDIYAAIRPIQRRFRRRRMADFAKRFSITPETRILDVGGTSFNWDLSPVRPRVTLLNVQEEPAFPVPPDMEFRIGDGCSMPFPDGSFDIVYSNSVIEHVGDAERQRAFAREAARVGRRYYVQTPAKAFPVEPHLLTPFIHWLPRSVQRRLLPFTTFALLHDRRPDALAWYDDVRLLTRKEMAAFFPDAAIRAERVLGLPKSYVAERAR